MKPIVAVLAWLALAGCVNMAADRDKVAKIPAADVIVVETPPIQVMTIMQAYAQSPQSGWLPILIADAQGKQVVRPPAIPDLGLLLAQGLRERLPQRAPWWPKMAGEPVAVDARHTHSQPSLRISVERYEVAPVPLRFVFAVVDVSLRDAANEKLWSQRKTFSGGLHGERIDLDKLAAGDASQLRTEIERAAAWLVDELAESVE